MASSDPPTKKSAFPVKFVWDHPDENDDVTTKQVLVRITHAGSRAGRTIKLARTSQGHHEVIVKLSQGRFEFR